MVGQTTYWLERVVTVQESGGAEQIDVIVRAQERARTTTLIFSAPPDSRTVTTRFPTPARSREERA